MSIDTDNIFDSISRYAVAGKANDDAYDRLRDGAVKSYNAFTDASVRRADFEATCRDAEDEFCEINYAGDPKAKHTAGNRKGQWKYRTLLPAAYSSAKSALAGALGDGVDPAGIAKSALTKARAEATGGTPPAERIRKAQVAIRNALKILDETQPSEADQHRDALRAWVDTI